jgi:hypothetical protein
VRLYKNFHNVTYIFAHRQNKGRTNTEDMKYTMSKTMHIRRYRLNKFNVTTNILEKETDAINFIDISTKPCRCTERAENFHNTFFALLCLHIFTTFAQILSEKPFNNFIFSFVFPGLFVTEHNFGFSKFFVKLGNILPFVRNFLTSRVVLLVEASGQAESIK